MGNSTMRLRILLLTVVSMISTTASAEILVCQTSENWLIQKYDTKFLMIDTQKMQGQLGNAKSWRKKYKLQKKEIAIGALYFWKEIMPNGYPYTFSVRVKNSGSVDVALINRNSNSWPLHMDCNSS